MSRTMVVTGAGGGVGRASAAAVVRTVSGSRLLLGITLLVRPVRTAHALTGTPEAVPPSWLIRALGARLVLQGLVELVRPTPRLLQAGAAVDGAHAATMILAAVPARYRRLAATSGTIAALSAGLSAWAARTHRDRTAR